jgi:3(or 17)beta-hydroxysteroid dehydrogenase
MLFMGRVANKVALITGGASGLGLASARRLAEEGAIVVIADVNLEQGQAAANEIPGSRFEVLDVTQEANWIALVDKVIAQYGRLDILLNSAGVVRLASIEDTTEEIWRLVNAVGTDGTFFGCKHALRVMKPAKRGSIINMCSTASISGAPVVFAYAASKSAIRGITKSVACLSTENGYGVRCNSIHPGNMRTPMLQGVQDIIQANDPKAAQAMENVWVGEPVDVANMVLFLASDESISVNGAALVIDNTMTITAGVVTNK